ncbi:PTS cellobiose transporter subunit IIB [Helcococcus kunzii]|uniref:PTS cellobiose transporter subunit IIB n=1 Tax=Helcococcus kunzii TaxID=40091 RepID=UPI0024ACDFDD|nr:PTS cellobiose transporter subunit IIB [Helcococcus kunzii]
MKEVLLLCNAGMSSSMIAKKITELLQKKGEDINVTSTTAMANESLFDEKHYDLLLISPQVRMLFNDIKNIADQNNSNIAQVTFDAYAPTPIALEKLSKIILENI